MNKQQRKSTASYFYDISKGIAIVTIVGNIIEGKADISNIVIAIYGIIIFFVIAYIIEGGIKNE
ncbi:MAG: hypothetical protein IIA88_08275 [Bacteroidetes bacterium]|nr:hypothetical protein [Bacteroidota bacterium]